MQQEQNIHNVAVELIIPNKNQPRKTFNDTSLNELAASIKEYGIINPILVRKINDKYEIIAGERRYRAAKQIGLTEVPVIIKDLTDEKTTEIALIENLQRENLSPIEEAKSYQEIMKLSNMTQQELGTRLGKSQSAIANKLRLLNLPNNIQEAIINKKISERHARSLMTIEDPETQTEILNKIINEKLTVKEVDNIINQKTITQKEIETAIQDIMKTLSISNIEEETNELEEKEEKESDNMNNGNFFPNFNNPIGQNNNMSLNSMNMQSMGQQPMPQMGEMVMPTPMPTQPVQQPINTFEQPSEPIPQNNNFPSFDMPINNNPVESFTPLFNQDINIPMDNQPVPPLEIPQEQNDNMSFQSQPNQPTMTNMMESPTMTYQMNEPLENSNVDPIPQMFNQPVIEEVPTIEIPQANDTQIEEPINQDFSQMYEVPVTATATLDVPVQTEDNLTKTKKFLDENGISYKLYNNETNSCIIIEL